ncbi:RNA-binding protein [Secundilactobacillus odoratitofui DSM 19909 = JCM 15043]|uniref:RNA-binding protein n=1 Tax=Secundilactobacillus odoratitofui DSM 19909 = JCM 15043 TaxID=1423776 RepID=A0A0R1LQJ8_9LACO|nr:S1-like domain-containing RNA-binding protein [Secundilactobacillus odoratitofui]KRK98124.1 RNA-binding protein [Secundilactobacillus odoratitofui DSM 19909 = JCM 15043]
MNDELLTLLGRVISGEVSDENDKEYFVSVNGLTFRLAKAEIQKPLKIGSHFKGYAYENEQHQLQITRDVPKVQVDHYGFGEVVRVQHGLGVFVNIGLPNKDIVVSLDDLPEMASLWPQRGDRLMLAIKIDKKGRMWGDLADEMLYRVIAQPVTGKLTNHDVVATAYRLKLAGTMVMTSDYQLGFIHPSERDEEPRLGQQLNARVISQYPDGTLKLSLRPRAYEAISDDALMLLATLQHAPEGRINYTDKSDPEDIKAYFGISKGQFKRAVGHLMKVRFAEQHDGYLWLTEAGRDHDGRTN